MKELNNIELIAQKKMHVASIIYIVLGILLLFFIFILINTYILRIKITTAVVSRPIEAINAPINGYISEVFVTINQQVTQGTPLCKIINLTMERNLQLARIQLQEAEVVVTYYQSLLKNEQERLNIYHDIGRNRLHSAQTTVHISTQNMHATKHAWQRFRSLKQNDYISPAILEQKHIAYLTAKAKLQQASMAKEREQYALHALKKGMYYTGIKTEGISHDLTTELIAATSRTQIAVAKLHLYENLMDHLILRAPFSGKITQILKSAGNNTDNIRPLMLLENNNTTQYIDAYLTQDEIMHISLISKVKILLPAKGKIYHGHIIEINRTEGFIDEVKAQYRWRDFQSDRSARVRVEVVHNEQQEFNQQATTGMPIIVYFAKS